MTVVFCDLVASSALASHLDPEEFAALLIAYREHCAAAVAQTGGYISRYVGDGVIACFGYPRARGRDAQAAVSFGLAVAREIQDLARSTSLRGGRELAVRVGIDTGIVVAGHLGPENALELDALVGTAPNTAARLQQAAPPNAVVIGAATHELVSDYFVCEELPTDQLPALRISERAFRVIGPVDPKGIVLTRRRVPLVGRTAELELLHELWSSAKQGSGHTVLLSGEPGIGKSRITQELLDEIAPQPHNVVLLACSPTAADTPLYPAVKALGRALSAAVEEGGESITLQECLERLANELGLSGPAVAVLADALGLGIGSIDLAPAKRRRLLLQALQDWLLSGANEHPLLIVAEDLHWSDPSLLELVRELSTHLPNRQAMLIATHRSDFALSWHDGPGTTRIALTPLERGEAEQLLDRLGRHQTAETRQAILTRSDGIPLFLEEFTLGTAASLVPRTLQQLFTARLDDLGEAKYLAQCASVLTPHLEPDLLAALADVPECVAQEGLTRLVTAEVLSRSAAPSSVVVYMFRHAVLLHAAHESILGEDRRKLHQRTAALLTTLRPWFIHQQPEMLARHHASGGQFAEAAALYARAARRSLSGAALQETEAHVRAGLSAVEMAAPTEITETQLELQVLLGDLLIARRGYASAAVQDAFEAALRTAEGVQDESKTLRALRGLASFYQVRGPLQNATGICERLATAADKLGDECLLVDSRRRRGWNRGCIGRLAEGEHDLLYALEHYDPARQAEYVLTAGYDPGPLALANLCWLAPARHGLEVAAQRAEQAAKAAEASTHADSTCYALVFAAIILQQAGHRNRARSLAQEAVTIASGKGFAYWVAVGKVALGYDEVLRNGDATMGRTEIVSGLASYREAQGELLRPTILSLLAEAEIALGNIRGAQDALQEALDVAERIGARGFMPELLLRRARLCSGVASGLRGQLLRQASALAEEQGAIALRVRLENSWVGGSA